MENKDIETSKKETTSSDSSSYVSTRDRVINAIRTIYDPEIPVDIYDLGLIYEITVMEIVPNQAVVHVLMTLTSPNCPSAEELPAEVKEKVEAVVGVKEAEIELTFDPPYATEMMSEAAKLQLGFM